MREEINILWIDDTKGWVDTAKKVVNRYIQGKDIVVKWDTETDCESVYKKILNQAAGFNAYDIFLIDYKLSIKDDKGNEICGNDLIKILRNSDIYVDILFYSSSHENDIRTMISNHFGDYEGVYISGRSSFNEKVLKLIKKTAKKSYSLSNIRGFLTNETSENDFITNSIIYTCFDILNENEQEKILGSLGSYVETYLSKIDKQKENFNRMHQSYEEIVINNRSELSSNKKKSINFKNIFTNHSSIITQEIKYLIFFQMATTLAPDIINELDFNEYKNKIISMRNKLAHKKLDLCRQQKFINYADYVAQYRERACPLDCANHIDKDKVSIKEWEDMKKLTLKASKVFDELYECLISKNDIVHD